MKIYHTIKDIKKLCVALTQDLGFAECVLSAALYVQKENANYEILFEGDGTTVNVRKVSLAEKSEKYSYTLQNKNIKSFLVGLANGEDLRGKIGFATYMRYKNGPKNCHVIIDGLSGSILVSNYKLDYPELISRPYKSIADLVLDYHHEADEVLIIDRFGCIHPSLKDAATLIGIDVSSAETKTIHLLLSSISNNYSKLDTVFEYQFGGSIPDIDVCGASNYIEPVSIIVPSFNSEESVAKTLLSIQKQNITSNELSRIEVILVDDGSKNPLSSIFKPDDYKFNLNILSLKSNCGLSNARNIGIQLAKNELIICIDSDIILPSNFVKNMAIRLQSLPRCLFVSLKKNINEQQASLLVNSKYIDVPTEFSDKRLGRSFNKIDSNWVNGPYSSKNSVNILDETNKFRDFGFGRSFMSYSLPNVIIGHNMCFRRSSAIASGLFDTAFKGWGFEDTLFGAKMIVGGSFVIPVLSTGVYHIDHPPRTAKIPKELFIQAQKNKKEYERVIHEKIY
jgi:glycosyltransferase involved in cell wall biosynthesis